MNTSPQRQCHGKVRHRRRIYAETAMKKVAEERGVTTLTIYFCRHCKGWHLGHPSKKTQRKIGAQRLINLIDKAMTHQ